MKKHDIRNGLFQGLETDKLQNLNRQVARPIPLWSFMPLVINDKGRKITIPVASMLAIVSSYETVLAVTDAIVPVIKVNEDTGEEEKLRRHFRYVGGKPKPALTERRSPLAFLNHEHLHRVLLQHDATARKILRKKHLPEELRDMVAGFRIIRAYREKHSSIPGVMVQRWEVYKIDENITKDTQPGKAPLIDPQEALTLDYSLQCPPCFEMMPRGFTPQLMRDLALFMGRDEPFQAETTTAYKYKLWMASETVQQFNAMFQLEEEQRQEAIDASGENISAMPIRQAFRKKGRPGRSFNKRNRAIRENRAVDPNVVEEPPSVPPVEASDDDTPDWDFGLEEAVVEEVQERQHAPVTIAEEETQSEPDDAGSSFGLSGMSVYEQDTIILEATAEDDDDDAPYCGW